MNKLSFTRRASSMDERKSRVRRKAIQFFRGNAFEGNLNIFYVAIWCAVHRKMTAKKVFIYLFETSDLFSRGKFCMFTFHSSSLLVGSVCWLCVRCRVLDTATTTSSEKTFRRHPTTTPSLLFSHKENSGEDCILIFTLYRLHETIILINRHISQTFTMKNIV